MSSSEQSNTEQQMLQEAIDAGKSACEALIVPGAQNCVGRIAQCRETASKLQRTASRLAKSTDGIAFDVVPGRESLTPDGRVLRTVKWKPCDAAAQHVRDGPWCENHSLQCKDMSEQFTARAHRWVLAAHIAFLVAGLVNLVGGCRAYSNASKRLDTLKQMKERKGIVALNLEHLNQMVEGLKLQLEGLQQCLEKLQSVLDESPEVVKLTVQNFYTESDLFNDSANSVEKAVSKLLEMVQGLTARARESERQARDAAKSSLLRAAGGAFLAAASLAISPSGTVSSGLRLAATGANALAAGAHAATVTVTIVEWGECSSLLSTLQEWERETAELSKEVDHLRGQADEIKTEVQTILRAKHSEWESNIKIIQQERDARMAAQAKVHMEAEMRAQMEAMQVKMAKMEAEMNAREAEMKAREAEMKAADIMSSAVGALTEDLVIQEFKKTANPNHTVSRVEFLREDPRIQDKYGRMVRQTSDTFRQLNDRRSGPNKNIFSPPLPPALPADDKADKDRLLGWFKGAAATAKWTGLDTSHANVLLVWHGAPMRAIDGISEDGFASLVRDDAPDPGWFGNGGRYTTTEAAYACKYASVYPQPKPTNAAGEWAVLLCIAVIGLAYPITPGRADFPTGALPPTDPSKCRHYGRGFEKPADAHIVAVDDQNHLCTKPGSPGANGTARFHEIVLDRDSAILPLAKVYFK